MREHFRRAASPSDELLAVARHLGIFVPEGFTFVRRHRRGDKAAEAIYRSVSALRCFGMIPQSGVKGKDAWFQFQRQTAAWLKANGYEIENIAGSRRGDGGVDIQAKKGGKWLLVQCKYWSEKHPVGPAVVRELLGSLATFPQGASGLLVTSSRVTDVARNLCLENSIRFYEVVDFSREITLPLP